MLDKYANRCIILPMSRETERQRQRLRRLADYIEANPQNYDQSSPFRCVVGLGRRVKFLKTKTVLGGIDYLYDVETAFAKRYGVSVETAENIWGGRFNRVVKGMRSYAMDVRQPKASTAAKLLRTLAERA